MARSTDEIVGFRDDDRGYLNWVAANPGGFVVNVRRTLNPVDARLHRASCRTISGAPPRGGPRTGPYIKICSLDVPSLDAWAEENVGTTVTRCGTCQPTAGRREGREQRGPLDRARPIAPQAGRRPEVRGLSDGQPVVEAWTDEYIRFDHRSHLQDQLRADLRGPVSRLVANPGDVLFATYLGSKHAAADVENLTLYNLDESGETFANAARYGLKFELGSRCPAAPSGAEYPYGYRYELVPRAAAFRHWRQRRELATWDWIEIENFASPKKLEQVWLAISRSSPSVASARRSPDAAFVVQVTIRPPHSVAPVLAGMIKGIFDGVIVAFQAHEDTSTVKDLALRLSRQLPASTGEIEAALLRTDVAVLGVVPRLLHARADGVQWAPADDLCIAGELLLAEPTNAAWGMRGTITEVESA